WKTGKVPFRTLLVYKSQLLPWLQDKKQGEPHKNLTWITSYSHWFDEENIPFWDNYHKFVRHQSDDYPHNPNTEDLSQFS
ncbi:hypothetical protein OFN52_35115, partial [Escherichia coli]|nr:hypothetical protein [Escherichia coli]